MKNNGAPVSVTYITYIDPTRRTLERREGGSVRPSAYSGLMLKVQPWRLGRPVVRGVLLCRTRQPVVVEGSSIMCVFPMNVCSRSRPKVLLPNLSVRLI